MPGGASLTGPTKFTPVGRIRRLRRHPASCPVALCLPGRQNLSPVGRIRRLRRHPALCPVALHLPGRQNLSPVGRIRRLRRHPALCPVALRLPGRQNLSPVGRIRRLRRHPASCPVALCLPGLQNASPIGKKKPPLWEAFCFAVNRRLFPAEFTGERFLYLHNAEQHCADSEGYAPVTQRQRFCAKQHLHERHIDNRHL